MFKKLSVVCLTNFFIASVLGLLLRYASIDFVSINYRYVTHAHSHVAMLGWVYLMLYTFIVFYFIKQKTRKYMRLFWFTQVTVLGMLFSFPFQGYGVVSITFSTLHILCSYIFFLKVWRDLKNNYDPSMIMLKTALVFMLISTVGVWALGPIVVLHGKFSPLYHIAIQFFLHFQFNGWFLFAVLALLIKEIKIRNDRLFKAFYFLITLAIIFTFALPLHWHEPHSTLPYVNGLGVVLQILAVLLLSWLLLLRTKESKPIWSSLQIFTYVFVLFCLLFKVLAQAVSLVPDLIERLYQYPSLTIGYIHLAMLGIISGLLFSSLLKSFSYQKTRLLELGFYAFYLGVFTTEVLILYQALSFYLWGIGIPNYNILLFLASLFLPVGILFILYSTSIVSTKPNL